MQATVRAPAARNMITKTLPMNYLIGSTPFIFLSFVGYWAYGNDVGYNILYSSSEPKWAIALAYVAAAIQIIVSFHVSAHNLAYVVAAIWITVSFHIVTPLKLEIMQILLSHQICSNYN